MDIDSTMNALIAQFAEQAKNSVPAGLDTVAWIEKYNEIFAELIVRECVKVMYDNAIERKVPPDINQTPTHYAIAVLEHFGVEE